DDARCIASRSKRFSKNMTSESDRKVAIMLRVSAPVADMVRQMAQSEAKSISDIFTELLLEKASSLPDVKP
ncbi:MAG: hypothetical protein AAF289_06040, partial [Cyanobacteria bacterium P01_A01_bin.135]